MTDGTKYWFPVKEYGWGWGLPSSWQGWLVLAAYIATLIGVIVLFKPTANPLRFTLAVVFLTAVLVAVCWLKGEPPHWHWGKR